VKLLDDLRARPWTLPALRTIFWLTVAYVLVAAVLPKLYDPPDLFGWDKANHFAAFYALGVLGAAAYPRSSPLILGGWLIGFGALIELIQALPSVDRDANLHDWLSDILGVLAALGPLVLAAWRRGYAA
jgi:hypothetical protein